jgi:hypothetical protein
MRIGIVAALALPGLGMMCAPSASPPPSDDCASPDAEPVSAVALGPERLEGQPFEPWAASDTAYITNGAQGGNMLGVSLELAGDAPPACLAQRTEVRQDGEVLAAEEIAINTYEQGGEATRTSNTLWLIFEDGVIPQLGSELDVTTEAGGAAASAHLVVVSDRHRLLSLAPVAPTARVGDVVQFALASLHAPAGASNQVELATRGDSGVLSLPAATATIFSDAEVLYIPAAGPGTAELVVRYGQQELRASVTVE